MRKTIILLFTACLICVSTGCGQVPKPNDENTIVMPRKGEKLTNSQKAAQERLKARDARKRKAWDAKKKAEMEGK